MKPGSKWQPVVSRVFAIVRENKGPSVLFLMIVLGTIMSPRTTGGSIIFLDPANLTDMLRSIAPVGVAALAMTFVILTAGIDLSVGSIMGLSGVVTAALLVRWQPSIGAGAQVAAAVLAALLAGGLVGLVNGLLAAGLGIQPFVITLASMIGIRGLVRWLCNNERVGLGVGNDVAGRFGDVCSEKWLMILIFSVLAVIFWLLLNRTVFGRYVRAVGDNQVAARYAGLPVSRVLIAVYTLSGLLAAVAGILLCGRTTTGDPNTGIAAELDVIAVVVIGGTRLAGGKGSILGTVIGTLIIGMLTNSLGLRNVGANEQLMLKALIIVAAVAMQRRKAVD